MKIEYFILSICFTFIFGIPFYLYFRWRMTMRNGKNLFSRIRIVKLTLIHILFTFFMTAQLFGIFALILLRNSSYNNSTFILSLSFVFTVSLIFYGAGMYEASVIIENYSTFKNKIKNKYSQSQEKTIKFFHGPFSHAIVYGGCTIALFELALLDFFNPSSAQTTIPGVYLILIWLGGLFWGISAIASKTYKHQSVVVVSFLIIFSLFFYLQKISTNFFVVPYFFFNLCLSFVISIIAYLIFLEVRKKIH